MSISGKQTLKSNIQSDLEEITLNGLTFKRHKMRSTDDLSGDHNVILPDKCLRHPHLTFCWINEENVPQKTALGWARATPEILDNLSVERIVSKRFSDKKAILMCIPKEWEADRKAFKIKQREERLKNIAVVPKGKDATQDAILERDSFSKQADLSEVSGYY